MITMRPATPADASKIVVWHAEIQPDDAGLTVERLERDFFSESPRGFVNMLEHNGDVCGFIMYSFCYWASSGNVLWVSQLFISEKVRGKYWYKVWRFIQDIAKENNCVFLAWATENSVVRTVKLWDAMGVKNLDRDFGYSMWCKRVEAKK